MTKARQSSRLSVNSKYATTGKKPARANKDRAIGASQGAAPLETFTLAELVMLYDAAMAAKAAWLSLLNQPRCEERSAVAGLIEDEMDRADAISTEAIDKLLGRHPTTENEAVLWARALLGEAGGYVGWDRATTIITEASACKS